MIKETANQLVSEALLLSLGISEKSNRLNNVSSHTSLYRSNNLAIKIYHNPDVNLDLLENYATNTNWAINVFNKLPSVSLGSSNWSWKINPILYTGLTNWEHRTQPFLITPFIDQLQLDTYAKQTPETQTSFEYICRQLNTRLNWDYPTKGFHVLPKNVRVIEKERTLLLTKIWGGFSRYARD